VFYYINWLIKEYLRARALGQGCGCLESRECAKQVAASLAALSSEVGATGAAEARLHLKLVVPDDHHRAEEGHDQNVVEEDHQSREDAKILRCKKG